jgi:tRNA dimethylallyltransferase
MQSILQNILKCLFQGLSADNLPALSRALIAERIVVLIGGPTAAGKSQLALTLAETVDGTIINADSLQLYKDLGRFTDLPAHHIQRQIPHKLFGQCPPSHLTSVAEWLALACPAICEAQAQQRLPIVVGGTGMYLKALCEGLSPLPTIAPSLQEQLRASFQLSPCDQLYAELQRVDPDIAERLKPSDRQRISRALEVWYATGTRLSTWLQHPRIPPLPQVRCITISLAPDRAQLYQRIDQRFADMAQDLSSLEAFLQHHPQDDLPIRRALGVNALVRYLRGELDFAQAVTLGQQYSRNYAKRQITWFRHQWTPDYSLT